MKTLNSIIAIIVLIFLSNVALAQRSFGTTADVQTISGEITEVNHPIAKMKADDGKEYEIHMGPYWYWNDNGYKLQNRVRAQIKGEVKEVQGRYEFYPREIIQDGKTMSFTDDSGNPKWSKDKGNKNRNGCGKGNGNGNGYGKGKGKCRNN